ncbi:MAG: hypothetical protein M0P59_05740 [Gallionella sp.]|jgi:hypothetical protein|nr:hypothetical protein [Gallionella sp.]MCK9353644.1 hypothetical protein [Gallionella sp.]
MDKTRTNIIIYTLAGGAALAVPAMFSGGAETNPLLLASLAPALLAFVLLARIGLTQLDAAHSLSAQLGEMIERKDIRHLFVPVPGTPEMNAIGLQLNILIYTLAESRNNPTAAPGADEMPWRNTQMLRQCSNLEAIADAA